MAKNTDYLIIDLGILNKNGGHKKQSNNKNKGQRAHLNSDESGHMAQAAQAKNLVLTHFTKDTIDEESTTDALIKNYSGNIIFGYDLLQLK